MTAHLKHHEKYESREAVKVFRPSGHKFQRHDRENELNEFDALPQIEEKLNPEKIEGNMLREKIIALVENNPGKAAQIIHEMIHSSESDKQIA